jgi:hypothetical protein
MAVKWLSQEGLAEKVDKTQGLLVVVPGEECDKIVAKMEQLLKEVNEEMPNEGFAFSLQLGGVEDGENVPVFFVKETDYLGDEEPTGLIRIIPLGFSTNPATAKGAGLEGVESLNKLKIKQMAWQAWMLLTGKLEEYQQAMKEFPELES